MTNQITYHSTIENFQIITFSGSYYAVDKSLLPIKQKDLQKNSHKILYGKSLTELVESISRHKFPLISIIIPTRGRPAMMRAALDSLKDTTRNIESIEVILVIDSDDKEMSGFTYRGLPFQKVIVSPGLNMGELNMAGYEVSRGDYIFLLNDDVIAQTKGWDTKVLATLKSFPDDIVMVHVNDMLFRETLCTFPFVSRRFCEMMGGICPTEYKRYRIDDHIHNIFNLLAMIGHRRIVYMPEVIFEHLNRVFDEKGNTVYIPNEVIHKKDTEYFDKTLTVRKQLAVNLAEHIDAFARQKLNALKMGKIQHVTDSVSIRHPHYTRLSQGAAPLSSANTRVTIGVVSADIRSEHGTRCLESIKQHTRNYDLIVLDNNFGPNFNHAKEMNRLLSLVNTEYAVLMDDDVFVEPGWLDEMLKAITPAVALVTPGHKNLAGQFTYGGVVMRSDNSGHHTHIFSKSRIPRRVQSMCSAVYLLDMSKCGHLRVDEQYSKYFLDIEFGLQIWEAGFEVVCTTGTIVTHVGGGTLKQGSEISGKLYEEQRIKFVKSWVETGRYWKLISTTFRNIPEIRTLLDNPGIVAPLLQAALVEAPTDFKLRSEIYLEQFGAYPALLEFAEICAGELLMEKKAAAQLAQENLRKFISDSQLRRSRNSEVSVDSSLGNTTSPDVPLEDQPLFFSPKINWNPSIKSRAGSETETGTLAPPSLQYQAIWASSNVKPKLLKKYNGYVIVQKDKMYGVLTDQGRHTLKTPPQYVGASAGGAKRWIEAMIPMQLKASPKGFSIFRYEHKFFAIKSTAGEFSYEKYKKGKYAPCVVANSLPEIYDGVERALKGSKGQNKESRLVFVPAEGVPMIRRIKTANKTSAATYLTGSGQEIPVKNLNIIKLEAPTLQEWAHGILAGRFKMDSRLEPGKYGEVIIPWSFPESFHDNALEVVASRIANRVQVIVPAGESRTYEGENLHRLTYNKAYLSSMFEKVASVKGKTVLEVGCSDGLVCDILVVLGAKSVMGIDVMDSVGCNFPHERIQYRVENGAKMSFPDQSFDLGVSIATLEHVPDPLAVLEDMLRVIKVGGYGYVQAGPLYHSPFGHHMFSYFGDYPWIHLRKSKDEIVTYVQERGLDKKIRNDLGMSAEEYINGMLNVDHINGLRLDDYRLDEFRKRDDLEILKFNISYEGKDLVTPEILSETQHVSPNVLVEHGFEILFRKTSEHKQKINQNTNIQTSSVQTFKLASARLLNEDLQPWRQVTLPMEGINPIPSMINEDESRYLYWIAKSWYRGEGAILDLGPLAGGSTHALAAGLDKNETALKGKKTPVKIHSYDMWQFYADWGRFFPGVEIGELQDIMPHFIKNLGNYAKYVSPTKGNILDLKWNADPIEILFINSAKNPYENSHIIQALFPSLIPGKSVVIHQGYISSLYPWIHLTMAALWDYFTVVDSPDGGSICFVLNKKIPKNKIPNDFYQKVDLATAREHFAFARSFLKGWYQLCVWLSEAHYLALIGEFAEAKRITDAVAEHPNFCNQVQYDLNLVRKLL